MRISLYPLQNSVYVDGEIRPVDLTAMPREIEVVHFDTRKGTGVIQFVQGQTERILERDIEEEDRVNRQLIREHKKILEEPLYKWVEIPRRNQPITDFSPYEQYYQEWLAYVPPPPPSPPAPTMEVLRAQDEEKLAKMDTLAGVLVTDLQAMSRAQLRDWFDGLTDAQRLRIVRWMFLYILRRI